MTLAPFRFHSGLIRDSNSHALFNRNGRGLEFEMVQLIKMGVDGIISNRPDILKSIRNGS